MVGLDEHTCQHTRVTGSELRARSGEHCRVADTNGVAAVNLALIETSHSARPPHCEAPLSERLKSCNHGGGDSRAAPLP